MPHWSVTMRIAKKTDTPALWSTLSLDETGMVCGKDSHILLYSPAKPCFGLCTRREKLLGASTSSLCVIIPHNDYLPRIHLKYEISGAFPAWQMRWYGTIIMGTLHCCWSTINHCLNTYTNSWRRLLAPYWQNSVRTTRLCHQKITETSGLGSTISLETWMVWAK